MCMVKDVDTFVSFSELQFWSHMCHKFLTLPQTLVTSTASAVSEGTKQQCFWCPDLCHKSHPMQLCLRHSQPSIWGIPLASSMSGNQVKPPLTLDQSFMFPADLSFLNCKCLQKTVDPESSCWSFGVQPSLPAFRDGSQMSAMSAGQMCQEFPQMCCAFVLVGHVRWCFCTYSLPTAIFV